MSFLQDMVEHFRDATCLDADLYDLQNLLRLQNLFEIQVRSLGILDSSLSMMDMEIFYVF